MASSILRVFSWACGEELLRQAFIRAQLSSQGIFRGSVNH